MLSPFVDQQVRFRSGRSKRGLYDGKDVRFGNRRSHSMQATRRKFKPNVHTKRLYSEVLDEMIKFRVTTSALRSIDRIGGLDTYLLASKHVTSGSGLKHKRRLVNRIKLLARIEEGEEKKKLLAQLEEAQDTKPAI
ncbi:hypothetical protein ACA910_010797 [Epithemia clementina (nom. ined.)]